MGGPTSLIGCFGPQLEPELRTIGADSGGRGLVAWFKAPATRLGQAL
jgi:hypothetical protein